MQTIVSFGQSDAAEADTIGALRDSSLYEGRGALVVAEDTLFYLYDTFRGFSAKERASLASDRVSKALNLDKFMADSIVAVKEETDYRVQYENEFLFNLTPQDLAWQEKLPEEAVKDIITDLRNHCSKIKAGLDLKEIIKEVLLLQPG